MKMMSEDGGCLLEDVGWGLEDGERGLCEEGKGDKEKDGNEGERTWGMEQSLIFLYSI